MYAGGSAGHHMDVENSTCKEVWKVDFFWLGEMQIIYHKPNSLRSDVLSQEAAVAQQPRPQLDSHNAKDEKDKEAEKKHISQHGQCVQQQGHQDPHTYTKVKDAIRHYFHYAVSHAQAYTHIKSSHTYTLTSSTDLVSLEPTTSPLQPI